MNNISTSWMWADGNHTRGLDYEPDRERLLWLEDQVGFGCAYAPRVQLVSDFLQNGHERFGNPPSEVLEEVKLAIEHYRTAPPIQ